MKRNFLFALPALALMAACAQSPGSIAPVAMPGGMYDAMSCEQARAEHVAATANLNALEAKQRGAVAGDAVGVFLIGVPVSSLTGNNKAGDIGTAKGKVLALDARLMSC